MAVGKTAVGKRLARRLGWAFIDTDHLVEQHEGMPISEVFATKGEQAFRRAEREVVQTLAPTEPVVIATGGGTFVDEANRQALKRLGVVVCLVTKLDTTVDRTAHGPKRPLAAAGEEGARRERLEKLYAQRLPAYRQADVFVETEGLSLEDAVTRVMTMIEPHVHAQGAQRRLRR
jgi:shikimate kinase